MDSKGQAMSAVGSLLKSQPDPPTLNFWSPPGAPIHQALVRRAIPPAIRRRAPPVVGLVPSGAKRRQGNPTGSPKLSLWFRGTKGKAQ